jgi:hypothetical protein
LITKVKEKFKNARGRIKSFLKNQNYVKDDEDEK